jgi:hypothetical protein
MIATRTDSDLIAAEESPTRRRVATRTESKIRAGVKYYPFLKTQ